MDTITTKIAKLLTLAENAGTEAEAHAAFAKAQELASRHAIDLELARRAAAPKQRQTPTKRRITIGEKGKHANKPLVNLLLKIADANDVECLISAQSTYVVAFGMPSDIDAAEAMWASLATTMTRFGDQHVRDKNAAWRSETVTVWNNRDWEYVTKPISAQSARRSFFDGFVSRIGVRLMEAREASIKQADEHFHNSGEPVAAVTGSSDANLPSSMALVLKEKRQEVNAYLYDDFRRQYGRAPRASYNGGSNGQHSASSSRAGRAAADRVDLGGRRGIAS